MSNYLDFIIELIFVKNDITPCAVILVPGGSHPQLAERAAELYIKGMAKFIQFSGHANPKIPDFPSEAEYLKSIAVNLGVPADSIICEYEASNTFQNAEFSLALLKIMCINIDKVILVCKAFHSRRALLSYQHSFPRTTEFLVESIEDNRGINKDNWTTKDEYVRVVMREVEKIGKYFCDKIYGMNQ